MKISITKELDPKSDALVIGIFEGDNYRKLPGTLAADIDLAIKRELFCVRYGETFLAKAGALQYFKILVLGLGKKEEFTLEKLRKTIGKTIKSIKSSKLESLTTNLA